MRATRTRNANLWGTVSVWLNRHAQVGAPLAAAGLAAGLYLATMMRIVSGCASEYCLDVGEFQVALPLWGTVHYTGYPLYMMLGSPFVSGLSLLGVAPAAGASLYSLMWQVLAVALVVSLLVRLTAQPFLAWSIASLLAVTEPVWVHGVLAEVYSLSLAICAAMLNVTGRLFERWSDRLGWLLAFLGGLGVAHHRLIALMLPGIGIGLLPAIVRQPRWRRWLAGAVGCFAAGFLPYLDLPLRVWRGSTWNYDRPDTWAGFWRIFLGQEVSGLQRPLTAASSLVDAGSEVVQTLATTFTWPGLALTAAAACVAARPGQNRRIALVAAAIAVTYLAFGSVFRQAVLLEAQLLGALLTMSLLVGLGIGRLKKRYAVLGALACMLLAGYLAVRNYAAVRALTTDQAAVRYVDQMTHLEAPPGAVIMEPWGGNFFALTYAQRIEGRLPDWLLVDHRADFARLAATRSRIYAAADTLYVFGPDWWADRLGRPLRLTSAGPHLVALTAQPLPTSIGNPLALGGGVALADWEVSELANPSQLLVRLDWTTQHSLLEDYSTYVHVTDQAEIAQPDDLLAQSDYASPVYGWYPTSAWQPYEIIREHHVLALPAGRTPRTIFVGMYRIGAANGFERLGQITLTPALDGHWLAQP